MLVQNTMEDLGDSPMGGLNAALLFGFLLFLKNGGRLLEHLERNKEGCDTKSRCKCEPAVTPPEASRSSFVDLPLNRVLHKLTATSQ